MFDAYVICVFKIKLKIVYQTNVKVCVRGRCCTKTNVPKAVVNVRTAEDRRYCPFAGTFSVGLACSRTSDCSTAAAASAPSSTFPLPLLECVKQSGRCCTTSRYRKPLQRGSWCLNGGQALGNSAQTGVGNRRNGLFSGQTTTKNANNF